MTFQHQVFKITRNDLHTNQESEIFKIVLGHNEINGVLKEKKGEAFPDPQW